MPVIDLTLATAGLTRVTGDIARDGDILNITALGAHQLWVEDVDLVIGRIGGVKAGAHPIIAAAEEATVGLRLDLLRDPDLGGVDFIVDTGGRIRLDASDSDGTGHPGRFGLTFGSGHTGTFAYVPAPDDGAEPLAFDVTDMQAGDQFAIEGGRSWQIDTIGLINPPPETAYRDGALHLVAAGGQGQMVRAAIAMGQADANIFFANQLTYLNGGLFTFPGTPLCYGDGTLILTERGYRPVETLRAGDRLRCADGAIRHIVWKSATALDARALDLRPELRPVRIAAGALGPGYPFADLVVSPQHRIYVNGPAIRDETGGAGGLIAVKHLVGLPGIGPAGWRQGVRYHHLLMAEHEILVANGLLSESLLLGPWSMRNLDARTRRSLIRLLPDFRRSMSGGDRSRHILLTGHVARRAMARHGCRAALFFDPAGARPAPQMARP